MRMVLVVGVTALALVGCQSAGQYAVADDSYCASLGAKPGSDAYVQCRLTLRQQHAADQGAGFRAAAAAIGGAGDGLAQAQAANAANRPLNCTSTNMGAGTVNTTCY